MMGWVMVRGNRACQEETETEEKLTPEEERRKEMMKYPYLTWFLRTQMAGREVEKWCKERLRKEKMRPKELEEEMKKRLRDKKNPPLPYLSPNLSTQLAFYDITLDAFQSAPSKPELLSLL